MDGDGSFPGGLVRAADGNIYGTTRTGGNGDVYFGAGTVFKVTPTGAISTLYTFTGGTDGANPDGPLVQGSDGSLDGRQPGVRPCFA